MDCSGGQHVDVGAVVMGHRRPSNGRYESVLRTSVSTPSATTGLRRRVCTPIRYCSNNETSTYLPLITSRSASTAASATLSHRSRRVLRDLVFGGS